MAKVIKYGDDAKKALAIGIKTVAKCVASTLGAKGRFVALDRDYTTPLITNDGITIAKDISLPDKFEDMGCKIVREASSKTNTDAGDGTTTAVVLTDSMTEIGIRAISKGHNPIGVKKGVELATQMAVNYIKKLATPIKGAEDIAKVATISSRDAEYGKIISQIIGKLGNDAVISVENSNTGETTFDVTEGLQFENGYITPYMITDPDKMIAEYNSTYVLITDQKITNIQDILPILEEISRDGNNLLIISDDVSNDILGALINNKLRGSLNVVCVKPPKFGEMRIDWLEDIAALTGGTFINSKLGMKLKDITFNQLGLAKKVKVDQNSTTIIGGVSDSSIIKERIDFIKTQIDLCEIDYDREKLQERYAKLTGGVAVIKVGASTEIELKDKKLRLEDALSATKAAIDEGVVPGGGIALLETHNYLSTYLLNNRGRMSEDEAAGFALVTDSLEAPFCTIVNNAGFDSDEVYNELSARQLGDKKLIGFDVVKNEYVDMLESGIIDPAKVTRSALQNAASVAGMVLTTEVLVAEEDKKKDNQ